jgi:hypothetical protein
MYFDPSGSLKMRQMKASVNTCRRKILADLNHPIYSYFPKVILTICVYVTASHIMDKSYGSRA